MTEEEETTNHKLFGEKFYDKITNKDTYNEDDIAENTELKYINILENIRDNDVELFNKIKYLPKKARTARIYNKQKGFDVEKNALITFFRKGALKKIYITDGNKFEDLGFDDAVKFFECKPDCEKQKINREYYDLLDFNKTQFNKSSEDEEIITPQKGGSSNEREVKLRIEYAIKEGRLTDSQEDYLKKVLALYEQGLAPKEASKNIKDEISKTMDSLDVYKSVKNNIADTYLTNKRETKKTDNKQREIILSEMLLI